MRLSVGWLIVYLGMLALPPLWYEFCRRLPADPVIQAVLFAGGLLTAVAFIACKATYTEDDYEE